jgi:hypothetical protein
VPVRLEGRGRVFTVIHSRLEVRNAVDPAHAEALHEALLAFAADDSADVAVFWGERGSVDAAVAVKREWNNCARIFRAEGAAGVAAFAAGVGRHGSSRNSSRP